MPENDRMKLIYVAGPYRAPSEWELVANIRRAEDIAIELWQIGLAVICPHKNTAFFGGATDDEVWLAGDREMIRRSDAVYAMERWEQSSGSRTEIELARQLGIPIFGTLEEVKTWLQYLG